MSNVVTTSALQNPFMCVDLTQADIKIYDLQCLSL